MDEFLQQQADEAPEAGYINVNYGKLTVNPQVITWTGDKDNRTPVRTPLKAGQPLTNQQTLELEFDIDISEFNPALEFSYTRRVNVKKSGTIKTDWGEITEPSLIDVFGKNWAKAVMAQPYVEVEDAPNIAGKAGKTGKLFGVPKFLRVFASKAECAEAREERYGKGDGSSGGGIAPDATVKQVSELIASIKNDDTVMEMLNNKSFGDYDAKDLFDRAKELSEE